MKKQLVFLVYLFYITNTFGQSEKFDIATFIRPQGWQRLDSMGVLAFHDYRTANGLTSFGQIVLFPSWASNNAPMKNFQQEWSDKVVKTTGVKTKPLTQVEKTTDGWTVVTGSANISAQGVNYACILVTISGFGKAMSVMVNTAGTDHAAAIEKFFDGLNLDARAVASVDQQIKSANPTGTNIHESATLNNYEFIPPQGWRVQRQKDQILIQNMESGCRILLLEPQPFSGNLEQDVRAVFEMMYPGWGNQQKGEKQYTLSKGFLTRGMEYCMMEATMNMTSADGQYHSEDGVALVVKTGNQIVIIAVRHTGLFGHIDCRNKYETWRRFFNSFTVKNATIPKNTDEDPSKRIVGVWSLADGGMALGEYVFAANGNYSFGGAVGTSSTSRDYNYEYLHLTTYSFEGDGSYAIEGNLLYRQRRGDKNPERAQFRFEKVNHGGVGWKDRLLLLELDSTIGGPYEVCYEKKDR